MALPATEAFTASDWTAVSSLTNWDAATAAEIYIVSNHTQGGNNDALATWKSDTFDDDQYAEATMAAVFDWSGFGVAVRGSQSALTAYCYVVHQSARYLYKASAGTYTALGEYTSGGVSVADVIRIEASGTTITPVLNGSTDSSIGAKTDSAIASGYAGIADKSMAGGGTGVDDWEGGNLGETPAVVVARVGGFKTLLGVGR